MSDSQPIPKTKPQFLEIVRVHSGFLPLGGGILVLSLFTFLPESYGLMVQWPWVVLWQLGMLSIALWTLWQLRQFRRPFPLLGHKLDWAMALTLLSLLLSTLFAYQPQPATWYLVMAGGYGITLYALNVWLNKEDAIAPSSLWREWLLGWLGICAVISSAVSTSFWWLNRRELALAIEKVNPYPLGHHNFVAGYLVLVLPVLVAKTWVERGWQRWFWGVGSGLTIAALYTTGSRGGVLGFFSLLPVVLIILFFRANHRQRLQIAVFGGLTLLFLGAIALTNPRVQRLVSILSSGRLEGTWEFRVFTIEAGLGLWRDFPWLGIGPGNTIKLYDLYRPVEAGIQAFRVQQLHCTPVQLLAELGLLGFGVYLLWTGLLLRLGWRLYRLPLKHPQERVALYGCSAGLFAYSISSLTDYQLENIGISLTLVSFIAILVNLGRGEGEKTTQKLFEGDRSPPLQQPTSPPGARLRRSLSLLGFAVVLAALPVWVPVDAAMMLARSGTASLQQGDIAGFYDQWYTAAKLVPTDPYYEFQIGAQLNQIVEQLNLSPLAASGEKSQSDRQQLLFMRARESLQRAVQLVPTDELFNRYLGAFLLTAEPEQAVKYLRRAAQLTPRKPYTYAMLGDAYLKASNPTRAKAAFTLEGLIDPAFFTLPNWQEPAFKPLLLSTTKETIKLYREVIATISPNLPEYNQVYQNLVMLQWWIGELPPAQAERMVEMQRLNPIAQALILVDVGKTEAALKKLQVELKSPAPLVGWIVPEHYQAEASRQVLQGLIGTIQQKRQVRPWLVSLPSTTRAISSRLGFFSYRNMNGLDSVALPRELPINSIVRNLGLFSNIGTLPVFDRTLVASQKRLLNLDRPLFQAKS